MRPGEVVDTTGDPAWSPFAVEIRVAEPVAAWGHDPEHLDGPLSWAAHLAAVASGARLVPMTREWVPDMRLPLATWAALGAGHPKLDAATPGHVWGWACSRAAWTPVAHTRIEVRRKPDLEAMAQYSDAARFNVAIGPTKARDNKVGAQWPGVITWHALGDPDATRDLLTHLTHLGRLTRHGHGRIHSVTVTPHVDRDAWRDRVWPNQGRPIRAPYWHHSRIA